MLRVRAVGNEHGDSNRRRCAEATWVWEETEHEGQADETQVERNREHYVFNSYEYHKK